MLILYYFLGLLLFLLLLTLVPVQAVIRFQEGFALELRYLFLRFPIIPGDEQPLEDAEEKEEEKEEEPAKEKLYGMARLRLESMGPAAGCSAWRPAGIRASRWI